MVRGIEQDLADNFNRGKEETDLDRELVAPAIAITGNNETTFSKATSTSTTHLFWFELSLIISANIISNLLKTFWVYLLLFKFISTFNERVVIQARIPTVEISKKVTKISDICVKAFSLIVFIVVNLV